MDCTKRLSEVGYVGDFIDSVKLLNSYKNRRTYLYKKENILENIYENLGYPCDTITSVSDYRNNFISNINRNKKEKNEKELSLESEKNINSLLTENVNVSTVIIKINYPVSNDAYFKFKINPEYQVTFVDLQYLHIISYKLTYLIEESDDKNPGYIPGMLNRQSSDGRFGIWGHVIEDLTYNGLSELIVYGSDNKHGNHAYYRAGCDS